MRSVATRSIHQFSLSESFSRLNGEHSFKDANPGAFVDYAARTRRGGKVFYFNFALAREMGLIPSASASGSTEGAELTPELSEAILDAFSLVIINEWDLEKGRRFSESDIKPGKYMATRYLQLQHPSRVGKTSGDGRGIWNGEITHRGVTWDVMSSGTGATCLSPATAIEGRYFKSGDPKVCYGNGYNSLDDGLSAALMSEIFHSEGISTERTLALIVFPGGSSINVRAGKNLLRPSHLFWHMKQGNLETLTRAVHYCIERERKNGRLSIQRDWTSSSRSVVRQFCEQVARDFAIASARFRSEYVFCWMDWDGDNILIDGGIIDYGSIRRFGAYHAGYRYDDGDRYSTRIGEQRGRARYIIQTFAQISAFMAEGEKRAISDFVNAPLLEIFDTIFEEESERLLLRKLGLSQSQMDEWMKLPAQRRKSVKGFLQSFRRLERRQSAKGVSKVADGEATHAVFLMSRFLREYGQLWGGNEDLVGAQKLNELCRSEFATKKDFVNSRPIRERWSELEEAYRRLALETSALTRIPVKVLLREWRMRASARNPVVPVTGNGILAVMEFLLKLPRMRAQSGLTELISHLAPHSERAGTTRAAPLSPAVANAIRELEKYQEGL